MKFFSRLLLFALLATIGALAQSAAGAPNTQRQSTLTPEIVAAKIEEVEGDTELDKAAKSRLLSQYRRALSHLEASRSYSARAAAFDAALENAAAQAKEIRRQLQAARQNPPRARPHIAATTAPAAIEQRLLKEKANLSAVEAKLAELEKLLADEAERPSEVQRRLTDANSEQAKLREELKLPPPEGDAEIFIAARHWALQAQARALSDEVQMLDRELLSQPMRIELLKAQRDQSAYEVERIAARVALLTEELNQRRRAEAERAQRQAAASQRHAEGKHPLLQQIADSNAALSEQLGRTAAKLETLMAGRDRTDNAAKQIEENARRTRQKLDVAGLSHALGQALLDQRRSLPDINRMRRQLRQREHTVANVGLRQIQYREERKALRDVAAYTAALSADLAPEARRQIRGELEQLATNRRNLLDQAIAMDRASLRALSELDFADRRLLQKVQSYNEFLAQHLLWVRSGPLPSLRLLAALPQQLAELIAADRWRQVARDLATPTAWWPLLTVGLALCAAVQARTRALRRALNATGDNVGKPSVDRFGSSVKALLLSLLIAAPWPLLLALPGLQLYFASHNSVFSAIVADALLRTGQAFFLLRAFQVICGEKGLADAHFRWPEASLYRLRRELRRLMVIALPAVFIAIVVINSSDSDLGGALGRLAFLTLLLALAIFCCRLFAPGRGALQSFIERNPKNPVARLRRLWLALSIVIPLTIGVLAAQGYMYTAATLTAHLVDTLWLVLTLIILQQLATRWLLVTRRRLALKAALERREAARAAKAAKESPGGSGEEAALQLEEPKIDLVSLSQESRELLNTAVAIAGAVGLAVIWSAVLPALSILQEFTLWSSQRTLAGEVQQTPVTLQDLVVVALLGGALLVTTTRLPAFLEIAVLPHFELSSGSRYTITTLTNYGIVAVGMVMIFSMLGGSWSNIQWLVAALSVGIGFGLQEIVANFISGLIILFERPIRVGDIVTIGNSDGVVTNIRIRATTIRDWDQKELLVPNKEFITGRLLNWTLSDQLSRVTIPVGIAYGSDVQKAMALILDAARENERVLEEPAPFVIFESFGDSALMLRLRCYLGSMEYRLATISELHQSINEKFKAAGLVIAFRQVDVHLDPIRVR